MDKLFYEHCIDNIFAHSFMDDYTTVILAEEEYEIDISELQYEDGEDFYCFREKKSYTKVELYKKYNIEEIYNN